MKLISICLLLLCVSPTLIFSQDVVTQWESYTKVGEKMPAFTVTELGGAQINLDELKGKVVLVNFWATWCGPCLAEMPRLEKEVWQKYKSDAFFMVAIAREQTKQEIATYRKKSGFSFPLASDPRREVYKLLGNAGIPRSYVVGLDGKILFQSVGYNASEFNRMKSVIEKELEKVEKAKASNK